MAERRMFTKKVTDDDNFASLSSSAQALYLHLTMSADDDGFCNQVSASMFKAHASVQDLQALLEKRYIYQFESGVIVIKHWRMANALRKDRYTKTNFLEELAQLQLKDNGSYTWLPDGCRSVATCLPQDRLGKDRLNIKNTNSILCSSSEGPKEERATIKKADIDKVLSEWNSIDGIPKVTKLATGTKRYKMLKQRIEEYSLNDVLKAIENVRNSDFLTNKWKGFNFEWFVKPNNFPKVLEGNYNKESGNERTSRQSDEDSEYKWEDYYPDIPLS
jgi:hypothetical protein